MSGDEMHKMLEELAKTPGAPRPMHLTLQYDSALERITGCAEEPMFMGEGGTFLYLLQSVFAAYPEMERRYPPGTIGFTINGIPPRVHSPLFDGDIISFSVCRS